MREDLEAERQKDVARQGADEKLRDLALDFMRETGKYRYTYQFDWLGVPVIQFPQDLLAVQELIFSVRPDVVIETGVAHGGGLVFYASMLELLGGERRAIGVDVEVRRHNRENLERHPLWKRIALVEGSSIDPETVKRVRALVPAGARALVVLDSDHTHRHVLAELEAYSPLVGPGSYVVVFDTTIEDQPEGFFAGKPWTKTNNPKTAVWEFLKKNDRFVIDRAIEDKLLITVARSGYLKCVKALA